MIGLQYKKLPPKYLIIKVLRKDYCYRVATNQHCHKCPKCSSKIIYLFCKIIPTIMETKSVAITQITKMLGAITNPDNKDNK